MAGKQFNQVFAEIRGGLPQLLATQKMEELIKAIQIAGKPGKLTVELTFEPHGKDNQEMFVAAKIAIKAPADPNATEPSIFYVTSDGDLVRTDPNQKDLGLRDAAEDRDRDKPKNRFGQ